MVVPILPLPSKGLGVGEGDQGFGTSCAEQLITVTHSYVEDYGNPCSLPKRESIKQGRDLHRPSRPLWTAQTELYPKGREADKLATPEPYWRAFGKTQ